MLAAPASTSMMASSSTGMYCQALMGEGLEKTSRQVPPSVAGKPAEGTGRGRGKRGPTAHSLSQ